MGGCRHAHRIGVRNVTTVAFHFVTFVDPHLEGRSARRIDVDGGFGVIVLPWLARGHL